MMDGVRSPTAGSAMRVLSVRASIRHSSVRHIHRASPAIQEALERIELPAVAVAVVVAIFIQCI